MSQSTVDLLDQKRKTQESVAELLSLPTSYPSDLFVQELLARGVDPGELAAAFAQVMGLPLWKGVEADPAAVALVPEEFARANHLIPVSLDGNTLAVVAADPSRAQALDTVATMTGLTVRTSVAPLDAIEVALDRAHGMAPNQPLEIPEELLASLRSEAPPVDLATSAALAQAADDCNAEDDAPIVRLVNLILISAVQCNASEVVFEPRPRSLEVFFKRGGRWRHEMSPPQLTAAAIASRIKLMASLDPADRLRPQCGLSQCRHPGMPPLPMRVVTVPAAHGEAVHITLLDPVVDGATLDGLGFESGEIGMLDEALAKGHGLVVVIAPPRGGATTTLLALLRDRARRGENVLMIGEADGRTHGGVRVVRARSRRGFGTPEDLDGALAQDPMVLGLDCLGPPSRLPRIAQAIAQGRLVIATVTGDSWGVALSAAGWSEGEQVELSALLVAVVRQRLVPCGSTGDALRGIFEVRRTGAGWSPGDPAEGPGRQDALEARVLRACGDLADVAPEPLTSRDGPHEPPPQAAPEDSLTFVSLQHYVVDPAISGLIPHHVARHLGVLPIHRNGSVLTVAMRDPTQHWAVTDIEQMTGLTVKVVGADPMEFDQALDSTSVFGDHDDGVLDLIPEDLDLEVPGPPTTLLERAAAGEPAARLLIRLLRLTVRRRCHQLLLELPSEPGAPGRVALIASRTVVHELPLPAPAARAVQGMIGALTSGTSAGGIGRFTLDLYGQLRGLIVRSLTLVGSQSTTVTVVDAPDFEQVGPLVLDPVLGSAPLVVYGGPAHGGQHRRLALHARAAAAAGDLVLSLDTGFPFPIPGVIEVSCEEPLSVIPLLGPTCLVVAQPVDGPQAASLQRLVHEGRRVLMSLTARSEPAARQRLAALGLGAALLKWEETAADRGRV